MPFCSSERAIGECATGGKFQDINNLGVSLTIMDYASCVILSYNLMA
jgi:hypothetical protein